MASTTLSSKYAFEVSPTHRHLCWEVFNRQFRFEMLHNPDLQLTDRHISEPVWRAKRLPVAVHLAVAGTTPARVRPRVPCRRPQSSSTQRFARGAFFAAADVSDCIRPGVVASTKGRWLGGSNEGKTIHATVDDRDSDMGAGALYTTTGYASTRWTGLKRTCRGASGEKFDSRLDSRTSRDEGRRRARSKPRVESGLCRECRLNPEIDREFEEVPS
jgi:hypothetical protein